MTLSDITHEFGLRHGALKGVHHQDNAVDHLKHTLHFAAEIRMAGGIDDIDFNILIPVIVCINKIDRPEARPEEGIDEVLELLMDLGWIRCLPCLRRCALRIRCNQWY